MSINKLAAGDRGGPPADEIDYHAMVKMGFQQKLRKNLEADKKQNWVVPDGTERVVQDLCFPELLRLNYTKKVLRAGL